MMRVLQKVGSAHAGRTGTYGAVLAKGLVFQGDTIEAPD